VASPDELRPFRLPMTIEGVDLSIAGMQREGTGTPLVFLHGFGSTKEDYADVVRQQALSERPVLAYDAPGCGASTCSDLSAVSIPFLVTVASAVLNARGIDRCRLIGHSMGGLTGLLLADRDPARVAGFVDIEGNVAPEDCFLSRQIISHRHPDPRGFLAEFADRVWASGESSSALYASGLLAKVRPEVVRPIFESMVELSDHGDLMRRFLALPCPRMFVYGEENRSLSYLPELAEHGVALAEIAHSGHWPMYANAPEMWSRIVAFVRATEADDEERRAS
jgi:pimeloyl-ACP methyl ester carboxylesterase